MNYFVKMLNQCSESLRTSGTNTENYLAIILGVDSFAYIDTENHHKNKNVLQNSLVSFWIFISERPLL